MNPQRLIPIIVTLLLLAAVLAACGAQEPKSIEEVEEVAAGDVSAVGSEGAAGESPPPPDTGPKVAITRAAVASETIAEDVRVEPATEADAAGIAVEAMPAPLATPMLVEGGEDRAEVPVSSALPLEQNNRLTAGEVDDNFEWDAYYQYLRDYNGAEVIRVDVSERHQIWVQDSQGHPANSARIEIEANGQEVAVLRTHSDGRAYFFPRAYDLQADSYQVNVVVNGVTESFTIVAGESQREWFITHPGADQLAPEAKLDVLFLIDATGSMADQINQLKENIRAIAGQIDALPSRPNIRFGMVTYRDRDDEFVTRVVDFTPDVEQFAGTLAAVTADGGGDYPEDLNEALFRAIHEPEWRVEGVVSLIFLVADAPPHLDYGQQNHYAVEMLSAAERGIKIFPIASSGLDTQGEYIFRQLAQVTGGRFIFLTYGAEGPGTTGTETDFQVSDYTVSSLDALVVKIVEEELSYLSR